MLRVQRLIDRLRNHPNWCAPLLGALTACAFEPLHLWVLGLIGLAGLLALVLDARDARRAMLIGWLFGLGHFITGNNWIATAFTYQAEMPASLGWLAVVLIALYLAIYPALATWATRLIAGCRIAVAIPAFTGCWIIAEWLRGWVLTGFPWNPLAAIALGPFSRPGLAMLLPWLGTYALSGLVVLLGGAWLLALWRRKVDAVGAALLLGPALLLAAPFPAPPARAGKLAYTLVQLDVRQEELHDPTRFEPIFQRGARLSQGKVLGQRRVVLWPESGLPDYLHPGYPAIWYRAYTYGGDPQLARARIGRMIGEGGLLLTGNDTLEMQKGEVVGARAGIAAIDAAGTIRATYAKSHLVPFGEYLPLRPLFEAIGLSRFVPGDVEFWPGPGPRTLDLGPWGKVGMGLCYEIIFPGQVVQRGKRPDYLFNPSNDGWYGAWGPPQHLAQARLRAIEEGLPVLRSTTTGISAVIDAHGVVRQHLPMRVAGRLDGFVPLPHPPTPFGRLGNMLVLFWATLLLALSLVARNRAGG